jgi:hypothetical protein
VDPDAIGRIESRLRLTLVGGLHHLVGQEPLKEIVFLFGEWKRVIEGYLVVGAHEQFTDLIEDGIDLWGFVLMPLVQLGQTASHDHLRDETSLEIVLDSRFHACETYWVPQRTHLE